MTNFLILGIILFICTNSIIAKGPEDYTCDEDRLYMICDIIFEKQKNMLKSFTVMDEDNRDKLTKSCRSVTSCVNRLAKCPPHELMEEAADAKYFCEMTEHIGDSNCYRKLERKNSECYRNFRPRLTKEQLADKDKSCKNYFGIDSCMRDEVIETCNEKEWNNFQSLYTTLSAEVWQECEWQKIISGIVISIRKKKYGWEPDEGGYDIDEDYEYFKKHIYKDKKEL